MVPILRWNCVIVVGDSSSKIAFKSFKLSSGKRKELLAECEAIHIQFVLTLPSGEHRLIPWYLFISSLLILTTATRASAPRVI